MLILLIRSHCKIYPLPTIANTNTRDRIVGNGQILQYQHFAEVRQKICLYIHVVVLQRGLPCLDDKLERFVTKKVEKAVAKHESDRL